LLTSTTSTRDPPLRGRESALVRRFRTHIGDRIARGLLLEHPIWSWVMIVGAVSRALSYWARPPGELTPTTARIEGVLSYPVWTGFLLTYAALIALGMMFERCRPEAWLGHVLGAFACGVLAISIFSAAVADGAPWSAGWPLVVVTLVHAGRANALGPDALDAIRAGRRWGARVLG
jgi:hypothetical protein